jgi:S-adenosylmethionine:tRNA ribosyltransferase-isomerase
VTTVTTPDFVLPEALEAAGPPPARDGVRLLVASADGARHARFTAFADYLAPGDLIVVNTSATLASALDGKRADTAVDVHFSSELDDGDWVVEIRPAGAATGPVTDLSPGEVIMLDAGAALVVDRPRPAGQVRLWQARPRIGGSGGTYPFLARHGRPIRYAYVPRPWPLAEYQTVFARQPGSAEMPSAGRPFTERVVTELITRGVTLAPIVLHTGVSSQEPGEPPQPERFRVPEATATLVNATRQAGGRVIAVGTTVTRALESAADPDGSVHARHGVTDLVLGPERPARVVTGLVTGWHAPGASHLALLAAVAGESLVGLAYAEALRRGYRWHEFGDSCLLLPLWPGLVLDHLVRFGQVLDRFPGVVERPRHVVGAVDPQDRHRDRAAGIRELVEDAGLDVGRVVRDQRRDRAVDRDLGRALEQRHVLVAVVRVIRGTRADGIDADARRDQVLFLGGLLGNQRDGDHAAAPAQPGHVFNFDDRHAS